MSTDHAAFILGQFASSYKLLPTALVSIEYVSTVSKEMRSLADSLLRPIMQLHDVN